MPIHLINKYKYTFPGIYQEKGSIKSLMCVLRNTSTSRKVKLLSSYLNVQYSNFLNIMQYQMYKNICSAVLGVVLW